MDVGNTEKADTTKSWSELIAALLSLAYQKPAVAFREGAKDGEVIDLCLTEHFIESQITNISVYDESDNEYKITGLNEVTLPEVPKRVVIRVDHMNLEYIPANNSNNEKMHITGQQYSFYSADELECHIAGREKAKAALNLAYAAKAMGWTQIDFGHTTDPIDRLFLVKACQHVGLDYGEEKLSSSIIPDVNIITPAYKNSAAIIKAQQELTKRNSKADPALVAVNQAFQAFFESPGSPIPTKSVQIPPPVTNQPPPTNSGAAAALGL